MTLFVTKHVLSSFRTGQAAAMADGPPIDGQRLAVATNSQGFTGPGDFRLSTDAETFVSIAQTVAALDTTSARSIRIAAGGIEWLRLDSGNWFFKAS